MNYEIDLKELSRAWLAVRLVGTPALSFSFNGVPIAEFIDALVAETEALREDAERYRALVQTMEGAKCGASLCVNEHLSYHDEPDPGGVVSLQWYPDNSVGFTVVQADTITEVIDQARGAQ